MRDTEETFLYFEGEEAIGFAMVSVHQDYVEVSFSSPTGYLEALFVKKEFLEKGITKELLAEADRWYLDHECTEMGSDVELDNQVSHDFHEKSRFKRLSTTVAYIKELKEDNPVEKV